MLFCSARDTQTRSSCSRLLLLLLLLLVSGMPRPSYYTSAMAIAALLLRSGERNAYWDVMGT